MLLSALPAHADLAAGKQVYDANCARCHGPLGAGDGPDAKRSYPKPRNLAEGIFKFRTTASGTPPTDQDLFHTISTGLPGSRMPEFQRLPEDARWQVIEYVKSLSPVFSQQKPEPVDLGKDPGSKGANPEKGKKVYADLQCAACHGPTGRGDGPSAPMLVDNWNNPIRAADLTQGWNYRGGSSPQAIMARFITGIDGTPMPSYADAVSRDDAWQLAYYVHSLQTPAQWSRSVTAIQIPGALPLTGADLLWNKAPVTDLRLGGTLYRDGNLEPVTGTAISVQALYNKEEILFRLTWHDATGPRPAGEEATAGEEAAQKQPTDAVALFLAQEPRLRFKTGSLRSWPANPEAPALDVLYWSSLPESEKNAREAVTRDFAKLESGAENSKPLPANGSYMTGEWVVVIRRPLSSAAPDGTALGPEGRVLFGAAVWNGANGERGRRRANSAWVDLILQ